MDSSRTKLNRFSSVLFVNYLSYFGSMFWFFLNSRNIRFNSVYGFFERSLYQLIVAIWYITMCQWLRLHHLHLIATLYYIKVSGVTAIVILSFGYTLFVCINKDLWFCLLFLCNLWVSGTRRTSIARKLGSRKTLIRSIESGKGS